MADPTISTVPDSRSRDRERHPLADTVVMVSGALVGLPDASGVCDFWDNLTSSVFLGISLDAGTGDSTPASGTERVHTRIDTSGKILTGLTVLGTPTLVKVGEKVYSADGNVASITLAATTGPAIGYMSKYTAATDQDVTLYTPAEFAAANSGGIYNMTWQFDLVDIADGDLVTDLIIGHKFEIVESYFVVTEAATTASKLTTISMDIGAVAVTNGAHALTSANCTPAGVKVQNTGALSVNTGSATDTLTVKAASTTAFAEGKGSLVIRIRAL